MLATFTYMSSASHGFLPTIPSPLSPRSANIYGRYMSSSDEKSKHDGENSVPFSKRAVKKAPSPKQDELKERRRKLFLKKVQDGREEKRYEVRGEDIMRLDYLQRQKQWEAELAREAPQIPLDLPEDEEDDNENDLPVSSSNAMQISAPSTQQPPSPDDEVDEVLQRENEELEALISYMPASEDDRQSEQHLWSDDDDYDALFSEFMERDAMQGQEGNVPATQASQDVDAMDMS